LIPRRTSRILCAVFTDRFNRAKSAFSAVVVAILLTQTPPSHAGYAYWRNVQILGGGLISGIVYSRAEPDLLYIRSNVGGPYRWNPATREWIPLTDFISLEPWQCAGVQSLAADPADPNRLYNAVGSYAAQWSFDGAILTSTNRGRAWTQIDLDTKIGGNDLAHYTGERLQVDPNLPSTLYLATTTEGLWRSADYGATWNRIRTLMPNNLNFVCIDPSSSKPGSASKRLIVGAMDTPHRVNMTVDAGGLWFAQDGQPGAVDPMRFALAGNLLYITYGDATGQSPGSPTNGFVYKCNLATGKWSNVTPPAGHCGFGGVCVDPQNTNTLLVGTVGRWADKDEIYRSVDGGASWKPLLSNAKFDFSKAPYHNQFDPCWIADIQINPFNSNQAVCVDGFGVLITENLTDADKGQPTTWAFDDLGIEESVVPDLASPPAGPSLYSAIMDQSGFRHDDIDASPAAGTFKPGHASNYSIDFAERAPNVLVRCHNLVRGETGAYASYSLDSGTTWTQFPAQPPDAAAPTATTGGTIAIAADASRIVWTPPGVGTFYSLDHGASWQRSAGIIAGLKVIADRVNPTRFYAYDAPKGRFFVSTNGATSFTISDAILPVIEPILVYPGAIKAAPGHEADLWLTGCASGLFHSTNAGATFARINSVAAANLVAFGKTPAGQSYPAIFLAGKIGSVYGIFRSDDQAASWIRINDDAHQYGWIWSLAGDPKVFGRLYVGTSGRGIICGDISAPPPQIQILGASLQIQTHPGLDYILQQATDSSAAWTTLATNAGSGALLKLSLPVNDTSHSYRIIAQPPQ